MDNKTEQIFIARLKRGDEAAYKKLYELHYVLLCQYANQWVNDPFWAESIVEDVIFHIWELHDKFEIQVPLRVYLLRSVKNGCLNFLKQSSTKHELYVSTFNEDDENVIENMLVDDQSPLGVLLEMELEHEIMEAVESLPNDSKNVFKKNRFEHRKYEEIAEEMNISVNTVKYHIKNALKILRKRLGNYLSFFV